MVVLQLLDPSAGPLPLQITADPSDSITAIRAQISSLHPAAPAIGDIRLVRGGRLLRDGETVRDVLGSEAVGPQGEEGTPYLIHLVLRPALSRKGTQVSAAQSSTAPTVPSAAAFASPQATTSLATAASSLQGPSAAPVPPPSPPARAVAAPSLHALADALSLYSFLAKDELCALLALPRLQWDEQQPAPLVTPETATAFVRQTMAAIGIPSALGDEMAARRNLDEWVAAEGQVMEVFVENTRFTLSIPPLATLSGEQQYSFQKYLMYSSRLSLLEVYLQGRSLTAHPTPAPIRAPVPDFSSSHLHALADALSVYSFLAREELCEILALPRPRWEDQQPAPVLSLEEAKVLVRRTMESAGFASALGDEMEGRWSLDERMRAEGQTLDIFVDHAPCSLNIPPLATLSDEQQRSVQRYLRYSSRLSLIETHLRNRNGTPSTQPTPTPTVPQAPQATPSATPEVQRSQLAVIATLMGMNAIKYAFVWYIFTQYDTWLESMAWAAGLTVVWVWEAWKSYRRLQPSPPTPSPAASPAASLAEPTAEGNTRPLRPLPFLQLPTPTSPLHAILERGLTAENHRLLITPPHTRSPHSPSRPSILKRLLFPPFLLLCSVAPPLEAHRRKLIRQRETAMRELSAALAARAPRQPDSLSQLAAAADADLRVIPDGLAPDDAAYWRRVLARDDRIDWAEEEEAQRRMGGAEQAEREREEAEGGLFALLF